MLLSQTAMFSHGQNATEIAYHGLTWAQKGISKCVLQLTSQLAILINKLSRRLFKVCTNNVPPCCETTTKIWSKCLFESYNQYHPNVIYTGTCNDSCILLMPSKCTCLMTKCLAACKTPMSMSFTHAKRVYEASKQ